MTSSADEARARLWFWLNEADDADAEQRAWKRQRLGGMLLACERTGVLSAPEVARWRAIVVQGGPATSPAGDAAAAADHLEVLLGDVRPLSRDPGPSQLRAGRRFHGALEALHAAGVVDDEARAAWHARELAASAPWLEAEAVADITAAPDAMWAIGVPAETPEQEAADAQAAGEFELAALRGELRGVLVCQTPPRHDGLAVTAVILRSAATELLFHHIGPPHGDAISGWAAMEAFRETTDGLTPAELRDDVGTTYRAISPRPTSSHGTGGLPDPERPRVTTGVWRYQPAAPPTARRFVATLGDARWELERQRRSQPR